MPRMTMAVCLLAGLSCADAFAQKLYQFTSKQRRYQITTDLPRKDAKRIADHMDRVHAEYDRRLSDFDARDTRAKNLYIFSTHADYMRVMRENFNIDAANTTGMFFVNERGPMLAAWVEGQSEAQLFQTLQHEGFHQFAWTRIGRDLPPWANEGLARYFGDAIMVREKFRTGNALGPRVRHVQDAVKSGSYIRFRELLNMPTEEWGNRVIAGNVQTALQYDQAWSIVHFLVNAKRGRYAGAFVEYMKLISKGYLPSDAFDKAFGANSYDKFEDAWKGYVRALEPDPVSTAVRRLQFLAEGIKQLHERGVKVATLEELKEKLVAGKFEVRFIEHGGVVRITASDNENFEAPQPANARKPATLTLEPGSDQKLPPEIVIDGLRPSPRVRWSLDENGKLVDEIAFR